MRRLLGLAWPVVLARSSQSVIGFCDALMVASLGEAALAATTMGALNAFFLVILPMGMVYIVQSFASQLQGKGDITGARRYGWYGLIASGLVGLLAIACAPFTEPVLGLLGHKPDVHTLMAEYITIRLFGVAAGLGIEALGTWYAGMGNTRLQMIAGMVAMVVNVFLNWVLIYGHLGAPAMGVRGAALASVIAMWVSFALLAALFVRQWGTERVRGPLALRGAEMLRMLRFGIPNGVNWFLEFAAFLLFLNVVVADLGTVALAAMTVVIQINSVSFMPAFGLASAGAILAGQAIGANRRDLVPLIVRRTMTATAIWQVSVGMVYLVIPGLLMSLFEPPTANATAMLAVGTTLLAISSAWQLFDAVAMTLSETLRAAGDTAWSMWARLGLAWVVFVPSSLIAVYVFDGGPVAAILCMAAYIAILAVALAWRFYVSRAWQNIDLTGSELPVV